MCLLLFCIQKNKPQILKYKNIKPQKISKAEGDSPTQFLA